MVVKFLGRQNVDFTDDKQNHIQGVNFWYHLDRSYSSGWEGLQVVKKFVRLDDPIVAKIRSLTPDKNVNIEIMTLGKSSVIVDVKEV